MIVLRKGYLIINYYITKMAMSCSFLLNRFFVVMDRRSIIDCLINSISRFIHLITCHNTNNTPILKLFRNSISVLKLLKSILDELLVSQLSLDDQLLNVIEQVDVLVNESREMLESLSLKTSTLYNVSFIFFALFEM